MNFVYLVLAGVGSWGLIELLQSRADNKKKGCRIPTQQAIFQANQAILSGNPEYIQAVMTIFDNYGCSAEADAMRQWIKNHGYNPKTPIVNVYTPQGQPGYGSPYTAKDEIYLRPGDTWRAAALLGGVGCAVGLGTIRDKIVEKGFTSVSVASKNPGWGSQWDADESFLECTRYIQATVVGKPRSEKKPKQVYRTERISVAT